MTAERLQTFPKRDQLLFLMSEFERARVWQAPLETDRPEAVVAVPSAGRPLIGQGKGGSGFTGALERALVLLDLMLNDPKWREDLLMLLTLQAEIAKYYVNERTDSIEALSRAL